MTHTSTEQQEELMKLADDYANACFDQALRLRIIDDKPEAARKKLEKELRRLHAHAQELEAQLIAEAARTAEQKLRADQLEQKHAMQAKMHAQAAEQLAAAQQGVKAAVPMPDYKAYALVDSMGWDLDDQEKDDMLKLIRAYEEKRGFSAPAHPAEGVPATSVYAEARECTHCNHVGINDSADGMAACKSCQWCGESPKEDKCPSCEAEGTMTASCPKCHNEYSLIASDTLAATHPTTQGLDAERLRNLLCKMVDQLERRWKYRDGNAPGHGHSIPGVWDSDNGELAGQKCAWCEVWQEALEVRSRSPSQAGR